VSESVRCRRLSRTGAGNPGTEDRSLIFSMCNTIVATRTGVTIMQATRYFAEDSPTAFERTRLTLLAQTVDSITTRHLAALGVGPGWRCLEVGAGTGSVARWLADQVGAQGRVTATDLNPRFLFEHRLPNLEVRRHDILVDYLEPSHYDLVHCRAVIMHLADPLRAVERMAAAVRNGGWLLLEEFDFGKFAASDPNHPRAAAFNRRMRTIFEAVTSRHMIDAAFGRHLAELLSGQRFIDIGQDQTTGVYWGAGPGARFSQMSTELLRAPLIEGGVLSNGDFDALQSDFRDPSFSFVGRTLFAAWGRSAA
jgi:2-polyprenyl-3-methyl-5-hydroxy-6-metoxy-1,4-benzoquinol methylase